MDAAGAREGRLRATDRGSARSALKGTVVVSVAIGRRGARRAETPRESRIVVASPELVELIRVLRAHVEVLDALTCVEREFLFDYLRQTDRWISAAVVLHPAVGPRVQLELRPTDDLRELVRSIRALGATRSA
jgi:hypothetical protein